MQQESSCTLHRGRVVTPRATGEILDIPEGALLLDDAGRLQAVGPAPQLEMAHLDATWFDHGEALLLPGFVDAHVHLAQVLVRGRVAGSLLQWLEEVIFPAEALFRDPAHARRAAKLFVGDCIRNGVTTAAIFPTSHPEATGVCFEVLAESGLRACMGLVHMDRGAPEELCLSSSASLDAAQELAARWHGHDGGRLRYVLTPRFAPACSPGLLLELGRLLEQVKGLGMQTHLAETRAECARVAALFPAARDYLGVYEEAGLVGPGSLFAHAIHLEDGALGRLARQKAGVAHCPSSNLFLKSGRFPYERHQQAGVRFGLGSDVAAGPELSPFRVMRDAYMLQPKLFLPARELFWRATLGGAQALGLDNITGSLEPGKEGDFLVVEPRARPEIAAQAPTDLDSLLAALIFLGDDRLVQEVYVRGRRLG